MKRSRTPETFGAIAATAALVLAGTALDSPASAAEPVVISAADFEDGSYGGWEQSGDPTLSVVDFEGGKVLSVADRVADFDGIQTAEGLFADLAPGTELALSMRVRLAEGTDGDRGVRFVMKPCCTWLVDTTMNSAGWTTVTGTHTVGSTAPELQFYIGTGDSDPAAPYDYLVDDILITATASDGGPTDPGDPGAISTDFEGDLSGWGPRADSSGQSTVGLSTTNPHGGLQSALVSGRTSQGHGLGRDVTGVLVAGTTYEFSAWVRFGEGQETDDMSLTLARTVAGSTSYDPLGAFTGMSNTEWVRVSTSFQMPAADSALLYFETAYAGGATGNTSDFFVDDILVTARPPAEVQDLTPIKDTVGFPAGVAIDSRETTGPAAELVNRHFNQVTAENYMKPEAWYTAEQVFAPHAEATALMDFAQENELDVYGHTLVWHSQTPAWFFDDEAGVDLTNSPAHQQLLKDRMRTHIFAVAEYLSSGAYGEFGSSTNPITAFDVVNEVIADGAEFEDGLRRSEWYRILGEEYIDLAFRYADEAFNEEYAAYGSNRPVTLFINDYNTEQNGKQLRLRALVERLLERDVPVDGVGHQFHVSLAMPVSALEAAIVAFEDLPVIQAVTELDVTIGTPVTERNLIEQGYYYRDAFQVFRTHTGSLFAVTLWGLTDGRSWRSSAGAPLAFDDGLQAKPAYYGIVDDELPDRQRAANVFAGSVPLDASATEAVEWRQLRPHAIQDDAAFELRWSPDHLTAYVRVDDATPEAADGVEFAYGDQTASFGRDGDGDIAGVVNDRADGYELVAHLPFASAVAQGGTVGFDVRVTDGATTTAWNSPGAMGTLTLVEPLSFLAVHEADEAPGIDAVVDEAWATATVVSTGKRVEGTAGATAEVRTLWRGSTLYVLAEVADPDVDVSGSDPWIQDSVEIYVDAGNYKNGSYRYDDTQIRISATNVVSFGTGDEAFQRDRLASATRATDGGYVVEAAIGLLEEGGLGTFHGLDFQVNDASAGARTAIHNWADPTSQGYQSTARWGVGELVGPGIPDEEPTITLGVGEVVAGQPVEVALSGFEPGERVEIVLDDSSGEMSAMPVGAAATPFAVAAIAIPMRSVVLAALAAPVVLATVTLDATGAAVLSVTVPASTAAGSYTLSVVAGGVVLAAAPLTVLAAADPGGPGSGLASTGAQVAAIVVLALLLLVVGALALTRLRRPGMRLDVREG